MTGRRAGIWLVVIVLLAAAVHIVWLLTASPAPSLFDDELGYQRLAQSLGHTGHLALFGNQGLSYSPLYPLVLSPLYALHLSGPAAYQAALVINCILVALASVPLYRIARFVLTPGRALAAVGVSALAPFTLYSSFEMSENLAYPLFLCAVWGIMVAVRSPSDRADIVALALCALCAAARVQFVVLAPAAFAAILLVAVAERREPGVRLRDSLRRALLAHRVFTAAAAVLAIALVAAYAGSRIVGLAGQYANQRGVPAPYPWRIAPFVWQHVAGLNLSAGVIPFAAALVATGLWIRHRGRRGETDAFAAVSVCVTTAVILITSVGAYGQSFPHGADLMRIRERYYFYVIPLFVIALVATLGIPRSDALLRAGLAAAAVCVVLPTMIPFGTLINRTVEVDTFGLIMFATAGRHGTVGPVRHALLLAVLYAFFLAGFYALARPRPAIVLGVLAILFIWISAVERGHQANAARLAVQRSFGPTPRAWVDQADGGHAVPLVENPRMVWDGLPVAETAFFNLTVKRLYNSCEPILLPVFGEQQVVVGAGGTLLVAGKPLRATYAVVPAAHGIEGRVVARNPRGRLELVQPAGGILRVAPNHTKDWSCAASG